MMARKTEGEDRKHGTRTRQNRWRGTSIESRGLIFRDLAISLTSSTSKKKNDKATSESKQYSTISTSLSASTFPTMRITPFFTSRVLASLEKPLTGGFCKGNLGVLDPSSPSLLELKSAAAAAFASKTQGATPSERIRTVFEVMEDHLASNIDTGPESLSSSTLIQDVPIKMAQCFQRSVLLKWLCDEVVQTTSSGGDTRFRLLFGEVYTPRVELPIPHVWVDITFNGEATPATLRVDSTRTNANLEPFLPIDKNNGKPLADDVDEEYFPWIVQSLSRCDDLGAKPTKGALDAVVAGLATPQAAQALPTAEIFSTAMAITEFHRKGVLPSKNEHIDPLYEELKQRIVTGAVENEEKIRPRELEAMRQWIEAVKMRRGE